MFDSNRRIKEPDQTRESNDAVAIRVLLADDHELLRRTLAERLDQTPGIQVVGQASNGAVAVDLAHTSRPDVVIMDYDMPRLNGVHATQALYRQLPHLKVIGLTLYDEQEIHNLMLAAGAVACLSKGSGTNLLIETIRAVSGHRSSGEPPS